MRVFATGKVSSICNTCFANICGMGKDIKSDVIIRETQTINLKSTAFGMPKVGVNDL